MWNFWKAVCTCRVLGGNAVATWVSNVLSQTFMGSWEFGRCIYADCILRSDLVPFWWESEGRERFKALHSRPCQRVSSSDSLLSARFSNIGSSWYMTEDVSRPKMFQGIEAFLNGCFIFPTLKCKLDIVNQAVETAFDLNFWFSTCLHSSGSQRMRDGGC